MFNWIQGVNLDAFYVMSQIFAFFGIVCDLIAIQQRKKARLLNMDTMAALCSFLHYLFLGAWPGALNKTVTTVRNGIAAYRTSKKKQIIVILPFVFIAFYIILGVITFSTPISLLPAIVASVYTAAIYFYDIKTIRYASVFGNVLWLIYDLSVCSIVGAIAKVILIINGLIAIYRYRKKSTSKKRR